MTAERDLLERALGANPPAVSLDLDAIEARGARRRTAWRLGSTAATVAAVAAVAFGGVALLTTERPAPVPAAGSGHPVAAAPVRREIAYCYRTADITSTEIDQHIPVGINGSSADGRGDAAAAILKICTDAWAKDTYHWRPATIPPLVQCVLSPAAADAEAGAVAVFPGDATTCARLGLPIADL